MVFNFNWQVFFDCNYNCSYCIQKRGKNSYETKEARYKRLLTQASQIKTLIENLEPEYDQITVTFLGGEISLLSLEEVKNIFDNLFTDRLSGVLLITNLSASVSWYTGIFEYLLERSISCYLIASFHEEYTSIDTFFNKAEQIDKVVKEIPQSPEKKTKKKFRVTTVITKENKDNFGTLFIANAINRNLDYQFNYDYLAKWTDDEKFKNLQGKYHLPEWRVKKNTEDIYGYTCSASYYGVNINPNGFIAGNVSCTDCPLGVLGITKKIIHKEIICKKHHCDMCGKIRLKRPDGTLFVSKI